ncbi:DUF4436 family protein [Rathayibacter sp. CAU 1779]
MGDEVPGDGSAEERAGTADASMSSRRRTVIRAVVVAAVFIVIYAVVVTLYALSGAVSSLGPKEPEPDKGGVTVVLTVEGVDAAHQRVDLSVRVDPSETLYTGDRLALAEDITVIVTPIDGSQTLVFKAQTNAATKSATLRTNGEITDWPFDAYRAQNLVVLASVTSGGVARPIPTKVWMTGDVPGWNVDAKQVGAAPTALPATLSEAVATAPSIDLHAVRSGSTVAFAFVLLGLLVVMPCLVLFVAITAYRGRRKLEPSFMSWMGAMLFATIPLRTFLPGSPPIGSWIDFTVVLWVVVGLIAGLAVYVAAWMRWGHPAD